ncbi:hypothetical protein MUN89_09290 [Halobacillus salinarum]|uniref:Lipoprotein n=1 Tax=Halobacillus salinarum TaxID=2932257 RepID=A0ABY4EPF8_9BACI|nr:DUF6612 family protein [Halobacillus salinarum]UOQ46084.1 hypothetical protein MUN89_09290 [Halobacillus salinarum]
MKTSIEAKVHADPLAYHQTVQTMGQSIEQYYTTDGFFISQPGSNQWVKAPDNMVEKMSQITAADQMPAKQLSKLKDYVDDFNLEEKEGNYILTFHSKGEDVQELIKNTMKENFPEAKLPKDLFKKLTINDVTYRYTINKESYYPKAIDIEMNFSIDNGGQKTSVKQTLSGTYSDYNELGNITVPKEIKSSAGEIKNR